MESTPPPTDPCASTRPSLRLLGPIEWRAGGQLIALPASRKVRALLAFLAVAVRPIERSRVIGLLWDGPADPRSELRWCLSRLRALLDGSSDASRVRAAGGTVELDLAGVDVDARAVQSTLDAGLETIGWPALRAVADRYGGEFAEGLALDRCPEFDVWLEAERLAWRERHVRLLERLVAFSGGPGEHEDQGGPGESERRTWIARLLALAPYDIDAHRQWLESLLRSRRIDEAGQHVDQATRTFEKAGIDPMPLRQIWRSLRPPCPPAASPSSLPAAFDAEGDAGPMTKDRAADTTSIAWQAAVTIDATADITPRVSAAGAIPRQQSRPAIAVMPFSPQAGRTDGMAESWAAIAGQALTRDVIRRLSRLRMAAVFAAASVFALQRRDIGIVEAARLLGADYVVNGTLVDGTSGLQIDVELVETRRWQAVWAERFEHPPGDWGAAVDAIGSSVAAAVAGEVELLERERAFGPDTALLTAWQAHHRALWHLYRFDRRENARARALFEQAVRLDPGFARPYTGLSFTHWQDAFQNWGGDPRASARRALDSALDALRADERDPGAHCALARAVWLQGRQDEATEALQRSVALSPNYAFAHYMLSFVQGQAGDPQSAAVASDTSRRLSPYDPLLFGMLATRGMAEARLGRVDAAADWAVRAAGCANAHAHIHALAAFLLPLAGRHDEAEFWLAAIRRSRPNYSFTDFLAAYRFKPDAIALFRDGAARIGVD